MYIEGSELEKLKKGLEDSLFLFESHTKNTYLSKVKNPFNFNVFGFEWLFYELTFETSLQISFSYFPFDYILINNIITKLDAPPILYNNTLPKIRVLYLEPNELDLLPDEIGEMTSKILKMFIADSLIISGHASDSTVLSYLENVDFLILFAHGDTDTIRTSPFHLIDSNKKWKFNNGTIVILHSCWTGSIKDAQKHTNLLIKSLFENGASVVIAPFLPITKSIAIELHINMLKHMISNLSLQQIISLNKFLRLKYSFSLNNSYVIFGNGSQNLEYALSEKKSEQKIKLIIESSKLGFKEISKTDDGQIFIIMGFKYI